MGHGWRRTRVTLEACVERRSCARWVRPPRPPRRIRQLVDAGMDVARLNLSHGSYEDHERVYAHGPAAADEQRPRRRDPGRPAGPEDPARRLRRRSGQALRGRQFTITTRDVPGDADHLRDDVRGPARRRQRPATRSSSTTAAPARVAEVDGTDVTTTRRGRRQGEQPQGHQPARRRRQRARRCRRRTSRTCAGRCDLARRLHRAVVRPLGRGRRATCAAIMGEEGVTASRSSPRSRSRRRSTTSTRSSRPSTASWSRAATSASSAARGRAVPAEARDRDGAPQRQAGHRRDPDAGVDDHEPRGRPAPRPPTSPTPSSTAPTP